MYLITRFEVGWLQLYNNIAMSNSSDNSSAVYAVHDTRKQASAR